MRIKYIFTTSILLFVLVVSSFGQTDSLMSVAKELIKQDKYADAEKIYIDLLTQNQSNNDVRFALGLMYSWSKQYDKARTVLATVLIARPTSKEVYISALNNELWAEKYELVIALADTAKKVFPDDADILLRKAKALNYMQRSEDAKTVLNSCLDKAKTNKEVADLLESIKNSNKLNSVGISYTLDYFSNIPSWHWAYIQYKHKTSLGAIIGRVNYANRFGSNGYQVEVDAYPTLFKMSYAYLNVGYSPTSLFPVFRAGMDYNRKLPNAFEASLGFRYLNFGSSNVTIFTGHVGKYLGNYWFSFRPYVTPGNKSVSLSGSLMGRRYFSSAENYVGLQIGYGTSPDDRYRLLTGQNDLRLTGYNTKVSYNHIFLKSWVMNVSGAYAYEEWFTSSFRSKITFDVAINYIF